ncbi:MAG TPA: D-alanyl-D-alanine carboxypeptidase [Alphaproteobacteria bacterium]|nr:D-alanyl-D-alanine carboxypeptidase [Alphaproteobacteria bacterium]
MIKKLLLLIILSCFVAAPALAQVEEVNPAKYGAIVVEAKSGKIIYEDGADRVLHPASLTKMMTLYMTFAAMRAGKISENTKLPVSKFAAAASPTKLGLKAGQTIRTRDAIKGLVTKSANDASRVLAEKIGGSETRFAQLMTQQAKRLGMSKTVFRNSSGLPDAKQVSSPKDMAILARAILEHFPEYYEYFGTRSFTYKGKVHTNHNHLMSRYPGMDGFKTGYVNASGFNLVSSAVRNNTRLIGVVFGGRSAALRDNWMEKLLNKSFVEAGAIMQHQDSRYAGTVLQPKIATLEEPAINAPPEPGEMDIAESELPPEEKIDEPEIVAASLTPPAEVIQEAAEPETIKLTAPKPKAAAVKPQTSSGNQLSRADWGVQIGAYKDKKSAQKAVTHARKNYRDLKNATTLVSSIKTKKGNRLYQARLIGLTETRAQNACKSLKNNGRSCVTVRGG